jgi:hypothetical protein
MLRPPGWLLARSRIVSYEVRDHVVSNESPHQFDYLDQHRFQRRGGFSRTGRLHSCVNTTQPISVAMYAYRRKHRMLAPDAREGAREERSAPLPPHPASEDKVHVLTRTLNRTGCGIRRARPSRLALDQAPHELVRRGRFWRHSS